MIGRGPKKDSIVRTLFLGAIVLMALGATEERGACADPPALHLIYSNDVAGYLEPCG